MYHQQRNFTLSAEDLTASQECQTGFDLSRNADVAQYRKGYFARLLNALHESRRLQATRVIRQYRHLVAKGHGVEAQNKNLGKQNFIGGNVDMANSDYSRVQRPKMSRNAWVLIAFTIVGFGILHVIGGIALFDASGTRPMESPPAAIHGD